MVQTLFIDNEGSGVERMAGFGLDGTEYETDLKAGDQQRCGRAAPSYLLAMMISA